MTQIAEGNARPLDAGEYAAIVEGTRASIAAHLPPGASYAAVSRGDEALLGVEGRLGSHFPRAESGSYAGHHPPDSATAIAHLEELRAAGVRYLAIPASSRWWLDHYEEFAHHLRSRYVEIAADEACTVYSLEPADPGTADVVAPALAQVRLVRFLDALLPPACTVLIAGGAWAGLEIPERTVRCLDGDCSAALAAVEAARRWPELAYAVVPAGMADGWVSELLAVLKRREAPIASRASLAFIFDLSNPPTIDD
ncbi:MAG: hypothetical protein QOF06_748 [Solirubrobacterales bacterium]|jgi:hypothetical protein|nr:hypothetical protein [Solirubrobacterales bacterium]